MFGIDFYPTPKEVIEQMLSGTSISGKVILEPSAGIGNIVEYCKNAGAKEVLACEIDPDLQNILSGKCHIIGSDFLDLTAEMISHVDLIIMNPPFSNEEKHILHAWDIAPSGCQIISLCNYSVIDNRYTKTRTQIGDLTNLYGRTDDFGRCFSESERQTDVQVGCIWLFKPGTQENEFEGYFDLNDYEQEQINGSGIVRYDFVQDIVSRYVEAVSMFDEVEESNRRISRAINGVTDHFSITFMPQFSRYSNVQYSTVDHNTFKKELQKAAWHKLFGLFNMQKYVTSGVMSEINKFVEQQIHVPFTVKNVYLMIQMIAGTHGQRMDKVLVEAFEKICSFSYENSTAGEGWRTNTDFLIKKKFILPYMCDYDSRWPSDFVHLNYSRSGSIEDVVKALCNLTASEYKSNYDDTLSGLLGTKKIYYGDWFEWSFFRCKGFKKGTMHFEFLDEDLWAKFNQRVAEIKGWTNMVTHTKKGRTSKNKN